MRPALSILLLILLTITVAAHAATPQAIYTESCAHCHTPGIGGAPRLGDRAEWTQRLCSGMKMMVQAAIEGVPNTAMAPRSGHRGLSDADIRAAVDFMISAAALPRSALAAAARYDALGITDREFVRFDANFDGLLTPDEIRHDVLLAHALPRFDHNRDGKLDAAEYRELEITLERERAAVDVEDAQLVATVRAALHALPNFPDRGIKVDAKAGAVSIIGVVPGAADARGWRCGALPASKPWTTDWFQVNCSAGTENSWITCCAPRSKSPRGASCSLHSRRSLRFFRSSPEGDYIQHQASIWLTCSCRSNS